MLTTQLLWIQHYIPTVIDIKPVGKDETTIDSQGKTQSANRKFQNTEQWINYWNKKLQKHQFQRTCVD